MHELKLIVDLMYEGGMKWMRYSVSDTAEYGDLTRGPRVIGEPTRQAMDKLLADIQSGEFAREWIAEDDAGRPNFERLRAAAADSQIERIGRPLRQMMSWLDAPIDRDEPRGGRMSAMARPREPALDGPRYTVAHLPGDGVGPEVTAVAQGLRRRGRRPPRLRGRVAHLPARRAALPDRPARCCPTAVLDELRTTDAILLGAVGSPDVPPGVLERGLLLRLRAELDLYVNLRPSRLRPGVTGAVTRLQPDDLDFVIVRENTEGLYAGAGGTVHRGTAFETATEESLNTRAACERCVRYAAELASRRRGQLTLVHKTNVLDARGRPVAAHGASEVAAETGVTLDYAHVDAACLYLVDDPARFDVIVTDNLFGDILSDLGAALTGGLGVAPSGNLNPDRTGPSVFEPVHGSAPDIAGTGRANPAGAVLSAALMLDHLGEPGGAADLDAAVVRGARGRARRPPRRSGTRRCRPR